MFCLRSLRRPAERVNRGNPPDLRVLESQLQLTAPKSSFAVHIDAIVFNPKFLNSHDQALRCGCIVSNSKFHMDTGKFDVLTISEEAAGRGCGE
jgi:hypothetical protein